MLFKSQRVKETTKQITGIIFFEQDHRKKKHKDQPNVSLTLKEKHCKHS